MTRLNLTLLVLFGAGGPADFANRLTASSLTALAARFCRKRN